MENITIENAVIGFKNFSGRETDFNEEGKRNFCLFIDDEDFANDLIDKGFNVKSKEFDDGGKEWFLQVSLRFDVMPPSIVLINSIGQRLITEETVSELDDYKLVDIDMVIRPYEYDYRNRHGVKAMLKTLYARVDEDEFAHKYANVPFIR